MNQGIEHVGVLRIKDPSKRGFVSSSYSSHVECWLQNNILHVATSVSSAGASTGAETWDMAECKIVTKDKKLDRFKIVSLRPGTRAESAAVLRELKVLADTPADAQRWIRDIMVSQELQKCKMESDQRLASKIDALRQQYEAHIRGLEDQLESTRRVADTTSAELSEIRSSTREDMVAAVENAKDSEGKLMEIELDRVALRSRLEAVQQQLNNLQSRVSALQISSDDHAAQAEYEKHRADTATEKLNVADATVGELRALSELERQSKDELQAFVILQNNVLDSHLNDWEVLLSNVSILLDREVEDRARSQKLLQWASSTTCDRESQIMQGRQIALPMRILEALREKEAALELRLRSKEQSDEYYRAECVHTLDKLRKLREASKERRVIFTD